MCPAANGAECGECGNRWNPEDPNISEKCPECDSRESTINQCPTCPVRELQSVRTLSQAGRLLERVLQLDFDVENFSVPWGDVLAEEAKGLQILKEERAKWTRELQDERAREMADQRRMAAASRR